MGVYLTDLFPDLLLAVFLSLLGQEHLRASNIKTLSNIDLGKT